MGDRTKRYHGDDDNSQRKRTKLTAVTPATRTVSRTSYPRKNVQRSRADRLDLKQENGESAADV